MQTIDVIDNAILAVLFIVAIYGFIALFWDVIFPAIAGEEEGDE